MSSTRSRRGPSYGHAAEDRRREERPGTVRSEAVYAQVPVEALTDRMLLPVDRVVLGLLADCDNGSYCCWPTVADLTGWVGCSRRTVQLSLRRLERLGWIQAETCTAVRTGRIYRLLWRRPQPKARRPARPKGAGGAQRIAPGGAMHDRGGAQCVAPHIQTHYPDPQPERARAGGEEEDDLLSPEELAHWQGVAAGGDRAMQKVAQAVLKKHAEAAARRAGSGGPAAGDPLAESPRPVAPGDPQTRVARPGGPVKG